MSLLKRLLTYTLHILFQYPVSILLFFLSFLLYSYTVPPTIYPGDGPLLTSAAALWGTTHPPGYPLFSFLGAVWSHLIIPFGDFGWRMHMFSAFWGSLSVVASYLIIKQLSQNRVAAAIGALSLSVSYAFWEYSIIAEVFSMHVFISLGVLYLLLRFYENLKKRDLYWAALFFSFGIAHHHTIILWIPGFAMLLLATKFWNILKPKDYIYLAMIVLSGFVWYGYVPLSYYLVGDYYWGDPSSLQGIIDIFFRKMYGTFDLTSGGSSLSFWDRLWHVHILQLFLRYSFGSIGIIVSLIGLLGLFRKKLLIASTLLINFLISGPVFLVFAGMSFEGLLKLSIEQKVSTLALSLIAIFIGIGIHWLLGSITSSKLSTVLQPKTQKILYYLVALVLFIIPLHLLLAHWETLNLRNYREAEYLAIDVLKVLPSEVVLDPRSDVFSFITRYKYDVENFPSAKIYHLGSPIDPVYRSLEQYASEHGKDQRIITNKTDAANFVKEYYTQIPTVIYGGVAPPEGSALVPLGITAQIYDPQTVPSLRKIRDDLYKFIESSLFLPEARKDSTIPPHAKQARNEYAFGLLSNARFFHINRLYDDATFFYKLALELNPDLNEAKLSLANLAVGEGQCDKALRYFDSVNMAEYQNDIEAIRVSVDILSICRPNDLQLDHFKRMLE